jgi:soluble lytic murein transglycosylase-like protein
VIRRAIPERWSALGRAGRAWASALAVLAAVAAAVLVMVVAGGEDEVPLPERVASAARAPADPGSDDPFAYDPASREDFVERATIGSSHVLYEFSPGGAIASAERTAAWRDEIDRAAAGRGVDPETMEAMVMLESAGRPDVIAGETPEAASGLGQILPSTATDLLGMEVDLQRSVALTAEYGRNLRRIEGAERAATRLRQARNRRSAARLARELERRNRAILRERRVVDERFQPAAALEGMATYLAIAEERFGRSDLAVASYHMGIGNLESVIERYTGTDVDGGSVAEVVDAEDLDYARLFFDSSPLRNERAWDLLGSFGDDSSTYLWRVLAAERILRLHREDPDRLALLAELQTAKATAEEVFHPEQTTEVFADHTAIEEAIAAGELVPLPDGEAYGYRISGKLGELAPRLEVSREPYSSLRPEALAALIYMTARVQEINRGEGELIVTSAVRDGAYQEALLGVNPEATPAYSLHTTGYSFDILRRYSSDRQASAFQFALDRLRALAVIDYAVEPRAIHVTVSNGARPLLEE